MLRRLAQYFTATSILAAACGLYHSAFVAWLEPDALPEIVMAGSPVLRRDNELAALYAPGSWQLGNCKRLQTRDGVLLFENWKQMSDDQWKLWPVSVVLGSNSDSPLVLDAVEGAEIKFTESLDVMSGGAPPIERGRMIGAVRIHSVDRNPDDADRRIEIEASEVGIDHKKIWTTQPIRLQLGDAQVIGRDLTLHLSTSGGIMAAGANAVSILDRLELIYLDELTVPLADGGLWGSAAPTANQPGAETLKAQPRRPIPLARQPQEPPTAPPGLASVRCGGRVVFQFTTGELTLQDRVEFYHQASIHSPVVDTFVCEQLRLRFTDILAKRQRGDELQDYLLSMVAVGRPVRATLPSFEADIAAGQVELDTRGRLVRLSGPTGVLVAYAGNRWQFGQIDYLIHPVDPKQLGTFDASGPGVMEVSQALDVPVQRLQWNGGIKFEQLDVAQPSLMPQFSLRVDGDVSASMSDGGTFKCESALLVLEQNRAPEGSGQETDFVPKRFQASGKVLLETPVIAVATRLLQLYFEMDPAALASDGGQSQARADAPDRSLRRWVKQPGEDESTTRLAARSTPVAKARPSIHGDTINAKLRLAGGNVTARDLTVVGDVALRHEIQTQSGMLPAVLTGDRLLLSDGGGNDVLQIGSGIDRPARFDLGDGYFIGPMIQVRMADNVVWIKDAGEFQMPTQVLPRVGAITTGEGVAGRPINGDVVAAEQGAGNKIEWLVAPRCRWKGQMVFDGRTAVLTDGVDMHATIVSGAEREVWDLQIVGDQLQLVLDQDVRVREVESVKAATIDHVSITSSANHPLLVTANQLTAAGLRKARHVLAAPQLVMKPQTGMLTGAGPGWYRAWMQTDPTPQFGQMAGSGEATAPSMFGIHLIYARTLEANTNTQSLDFLDGVRIGGRAVATWDDLIDVAQMQGLRLGESTLDCDRLRLALDRTRPWVPAAQAWEMEAIGNVAFQTRIESGLFNGTADHASYAASKDIFLIEGVPGRAAVLNQTLPTGQPGTSASVKRMTVNPKTMEVQNVEFDRLQLGTLPSSLGK